MEAYGFQRDVHASDITNVLDIEPIRGGHHVGPYTGRFNHYQQRRGSDLRIVPGQLPNSYRLIRIAL